MVSTLTTLYRVDVLASGLGGAAPADGFIDHTPVEQYMATGAAPSSLANSLAKERANMRYKEVREKVQLIANVYISNRVATGANSDTPATTYSFTCEVERGDAVLTTLDELNAGATLTGAAAIKRAIARAMTTDYTTNTEYYDPTTDTQNGVAAARNPSKTGSVTAAKLTSSIATAESNITVTKIAYT